MSANGTVSMKFPCWRIANARCMSSPWRIDTPVRSRMRPTRFISVSPTTVSTAAYSPVIGTSILHPPLLGRLLRFPGAPEAAESGLDEPARHLFRKMEHVGRLDTDYWTGLLDTFRPARRGDARCRKNGRVAGIFGKYGISRQVQLMLSIADMPQARVRDDDDRAMVD